MGWLAYTGGLPAFDSQIIAQRFVDGADNFPLLAVPFFLLAGEFMTAGGLSRRIVDMAMAWVGHFRGGLGYVAVVAAIIVASISGSAVADTAALAALLIPMMNRAGYDTNRSAGLIAAGGIIAPVIPPVDRLHRVRRGGQRLDHQALSRRHRAGHADGRGDRHRLVDRGAPRQGAGRARACPSASGWRSPRAAASGAGAAGGDHRRHEVRHLHADRGGRGGGGVLRSWSACSSTASSRVSMLYRAHARGRPRPPRS